MTLSMKSIRLFIVLLTIVFSLATCACASNECSEKDLSLMRESVVQVVIGNSLEVSRGTGWVAEIGEERVIVTARHVIDSLFAEQDPLLQTLFGEYELQVINFEGTKVSAALISYPEGDDFNTDWAILSLPEAFQELPALKIAEEQALFGHSAYWIGFPDAPIAVSGITIVGDLFQENLRRLDVESGGGVSGAPVWDPEVGVVGMIIGGITGADFAVALDMPKITEELLVEFEADKAAIF